MLEATYILVTSDVRMLDAWQHDLLPGLACTASKQQQHRPTETLEVVVAVDVGLVVQGDATKDLHPHDAVDEEDEGDQDGDPGKSLEWLEESPEQGSDSFIFVKKLYQTSNTEQSEKSDGSITVWL